jgi:hypothetical protein
MSQPKKKAGAKAKVKLKDLQSKKNPKGGALNAYLKKGDFLNPQPLPP